MLKNEVDLSNRQKEYFEGLLTVRDDREMEENSLGYGLLGMRGMDVRILVESVKEFVQKDEVWEGGGAGLNC